MYSSTVGSRKIFEPTYQNDYKLKFKAEAESELRMNANPRRKALRRNRSTYLRRNTTNINILAIKRLLKPNFYSRKEIVASKSNFGQTSISKTSREVLRFI